MAKLEKGSETGEVKVEVLRMHKWTKGACKASVDFKLTLAGVSITIYNASLMYSDKKDDYFVTMPNRKGGDDKYYAYVYIEDKAVMEQIASVVLGAYAE